MIKHNEDKLNQLIEAFLEGEKESFDQIASIIHQDIINIAYYYVGNIEDSKDILQNVLLKIYKKIKFFKKAAKFSSWIYRITANTSLDLLRKRKRTYNLKNRYGKEHEDYQLFKQDKEVKNKSMLIKETISNLSDKQKKVFILKHYQGLTIQEVSKVLGCSQSTVKTHLVRAVDNIRKILGGSYEMS